MAACFQDVVKANKVGFDIYIGMIDGIANACLGGKVNNDSGVLFLKYFISEIFICDGAFDKDMVNWFFFLDFFSFFFNKL